MKEKWSDIEQLPVRFDVGSTYKEAMSDTMPASVICFCVDGSIVLNGVKFGGGSASEEIEVLKQQIKELQDLLSITPSTNAISTTNP